MGRLRWSCRDRARPRPETDRRQMSPAGGFRGAGVDGSRSGSRNSHRSAAMCKRGCRPARNLAVKGGLKGVERAFWIFAGKRARDPSVALWVRFLRVLEIAVKIARLGGGRANGWWPRSHGECTPLTRDRLAPKSRTAEAAPRSARGRTGRASRDTGSLRPTSGGPPGTRHRPAPSRR